MACGLPYAIGAQVAYPDRQVVAFVGDGGFSMLMADFATAVKYELPIKVVVIKNDVLGQIKWEQMVFLGNPEFGVELQPIDFAKVAEACGGHRRPRSRIPRHAAEQVEDALRPAGPGPDRGGRRSARGADAGPGQRATRRPTSPKRCSAASRTGSRSPPRPSADDPGDGLSAWPSHRDAIVRAEGAGRRHRGRRSARS